MKAKTILLPMSMLALLAASCGNGKNAQSSDQVEAEAPVVAIEGKWRIVDLVVNDSLSVQPGATDRFGEPYILFEDGNYSIMTGCNSLQGSYSLSGDSITLHDGLCTEMACPDMRVEDMVKMVLPEISTVDQSNDSVMSLKGGSSAYISLLRVEEE